MQNEENRYSLEEGLDDYDGQLAGGEVHRNATTAPGFDLSNGIIKFFSRKKTGSTDPEFQIDLAKATVMYDDKRIVIILKVANEIHSLIPLEDSLEQWRDAIYKHRLYRQEAVRKGLQPDTTHTLETISGGAGQGFNEDKMGWESHSCNKMFDEVHQMQGLTLEVLEKLTKTFEEMKKASDELKSSLTNIKSALARSTESSSVYTSATNSIVPSSVPVSTTTYHSTTAEGSSMESKGMGSEEDEEEDGIGSEEQIPKNRN
ncbi:hypothetical protein Q1695_013317 [Nippostrongylus brasiliensis]|nr:hypothetical protein Q1695_013317 [Nippostrongylus brasiliensis]